MDPRWVFLSDETSPVISRSPRSLLALHHHGSSASSALVTVPGSRQPCFLSCPSSFSSYLPWAAASQVLFLAFVFVVPSSLRPPPLGADVLGIRAPGLAFPPLWPRACACLSGCLIAAVSESFIIKCKVFIPFGPYLTYSMPQTKRVIGRFLNIGYRFNFFCLFCSLWLQL